MTPADRPTLTAMLIRYADGVGAPTPSDERVDFYFEALGHLAVESVAAALRACPRLTPGFPQVFHILQAIGPADDGHPPAEVAWSMAQAFLDEDATVTWTDEMAHAYGLARPLLLARDKVAARLAFKEAYECEVASSRACGRRAVFRASLGRDAPARADAIKTAQAEGLLTSRAVAKEAAGCAARLSAAFVALEDASKPSSDDSVELANSKAAAARALAELRARILADAELARSADAEAKRATMAAKERAAELVAAHEAVEFAPALPLPRPAACNGNARRDG